MSKLLSKATSPARRASIAAAFLVVFSGASSAGVYNLAADWSDTTNPNGVWTYLTANTPFASTASNWYGFGTAWADSNGGPGSAPMLLKYDGVGFPIDAVANDIVGHTQTYDSNGGLGELAIRFTNPSTGVGHISGKVWNAQLNVDRDQAWALWIDNVLEASGVVLGDGTEGSANPDLFGLSNLSLSGGSTVEFRISRVGNDNGGMFGLGLNIDVTPAIPVPEPSTLLLTSLGLLVALRNIRRRSW